MINVRCEDIMKKEANYLNINCCKCGEHFDATQLGLHESSEEAFRLVWGAILIAVNISLLLLIYTCLVMTGQHIVQTMTNSLNI